jgi:hypothetical protein
MNDIYVFEADVIRFGGGEKIDTIHCMAYSLFQATHELIEYINDKKSGYSGIVELGAVRKLTDIRKLINPYFAVEMDNLSDDEDDYDPEFPYEIVKNIPDTDQRVMKFNCSCKEEIRVYRGDWEYIVCKNCENKIFRSEVEEYGGKFVYVKKT